MAENRKPRARSVAVTAGRRAPWAGLTALWQALRDGADLRAAALAEADSRRLFLWLPVATGSGIILYFLADGTPSPWPAAGLAIVAAFAALRLRDSLGGFAGLIAVTFVLLGFAAAALRVQMAAAPILERQAFARLSGFVETVDAGPAGGRMVLRLTSMATTLPLARPERLRVTFKGAPPRAGDHVSGQARLMPPPQPAFPGGYDFARDAYFLGLGAVGRWTGPIALSPAIQPAAMDLRLTAAIDNARTDLTNRIARVIGGQAGALSAALVTGKRGLIDEAANDQMRAAGIYHIVSISGLHMVLAAGVFFWLARAILSLVPAVAETRPVKKWAALVAMAGATAYCVFSGSEVATERSLVMTLVMLGAILFDRPALSMRNLAIAALIVLMREPETMLGPSFQMSFAAVAGMIAANEWWQSRRPPGQEPSGWGGILMRKLWLAVMASLATTLVASVATAPFAAYHFQRLNPYGLIGNALAVPFVSFVVMPAAVAGSLLLPFGLDAPVWQLMGLGSERVLQVARYVAEFQGSVRGVRAFGEGALLLMSGGFIILALIRAPVRHAGSILMVTGAIMAAHTVPPDIFIDREGRHLMVRGADNVLTLVGRGSNRFTTERWLQADGDLRKAADPALRAAARCDSIGCVAALPDGGSVALVIDSDAFEEDCQRARLIVTPFQAPDYCKKTAQIIDRNTLSFSASLALKTSGAGYVITPARPHDRWKPWYGRPRDSQQIALNLPPIAVTETTPTFPAQSDDDGSDMLTP